MTVEREDPVVFVSPDVALAESWPEKCAQTTLLMSRLRPPPACLTERSRHFSVKAVKSSADQCVVKGENKNGKVFFGETSSKEGDVVNIKQVDADKHEQIFDYSTINRNNLIQTIKVLRINKTDAKSQEKGLGFMQKVAKQLRFSDSLIDIGIGKVIVDALRTHPNNADIATISCSIVTLLTHCDHVANAEKNAIVLMRFGTGQAIMKSMKQNIENEEVQYHGLLALYNLTYDSENRRKALLNAEIASLIVEIMRKHTRKSVQIECCAAISNFQLEDTEVNKRNFINCEAVDAVVDAINEHGQSEELVAIACEALNIMYNSAPISWRDRLGEKVKTMLCNQLNNNLNDPESSIDILRKLLTVVTSYSSHFENRAEFIKVGLDKCVVESFTKGEQDEQVISLALYLVYLFSFYKPSEARKLKSLGTLRLVKNTMKKFHDNQYIQNQGRATLQLLKKNGKPNRRG